MTANELVHLLKRQAGLTHPIEHHTHDQIPQPAKRSGVREEPYLVWFGGLTAVAILLVAFVVITHSQGRVAAGLHPPVVAAEQAIEFTPELADSTSCARVASSDLQSPSEGLWFQSKCVLPPEPPLMATTTTCNRTALDPAEFAAIAPGLYVFRQTPASPAYLWYGSAEACFDLVSSRIVTAVCADYVVTFKWSARSTCSGHGGVLAWVNGR